MSFKQSLARFITGNIPVESLPEIAVEAIEEGLDSPSLYILAGLSRNENSFILEQYLQLTLDELGIKTPGKRQAALVYALQITREVISGNKVLIEGVTEIYKKAIGSYDFWSETNNFAYDSIGFEHVFGIYDDYDDLTDVNPPFKTDLEQIEVVKKDLYEALLKWEPTLCTLCKSSD